jgi:hypothetical protein
MPYVQVADPLLNSDKPARSTDIKQMRDNQDYFDTQITALVSGQVLSRNSINDDFMGVVGSTGVGSWWTDDSAGGGSGTAYIASEHSLECDSQGAASSDYAGVYGSPEIQRIDKSEEYVAVLEARVKITGDTGNDYYFIGWQDSALATNNRYNDVTDSVAFVLDPVSGWRALSSNAATDTIDQIGNVAIWQTIRLEFTCSATAGNRQVEAFLAGVSQGVMNTDANIPSATLVPVIGCAGDGSGSARILQVDYVVFSTVARPVAA